MKTFLTEWVLRHGNARVPWEERLWADIQMVADAGRDGYLGFEVVEGESYRWITEKGKNYLKENDDE